MMDSNVCMIASGKGGTGKTSLVSALGLVLAQSGKRVALVDLDMGQRSLDIALGLENNVVFDIWDAATGVCRLKQALISPAGLESLTMVAASQVKDASGFDAEACLKVIDALSQSNDVVLLDAPPGAGHGLKLACALCRRAIMVVTPDASSVRDAQRAMNVMRECGVNDFSLVVNRVKPWQEDITFEYTPDAIGEWLDMKPLAVIRERDVPKPLAGNAQVAQIARALANDMDIDWHEAELTPPRRFKASISKFRKRSLNAKAVQ